MSFQTRKSFVRMLFCIIRATRMRCFLSNQSVNIHRKCILVAGLTQKSIRCLRSAHILQNGATLMWRDTEETNCWIKSLFLFTLRTKKDSRHLHNVTVEPLIADGLFLRSFSYFSGPWQCNLLGSLWDSHKPPGFHPKYFKLCSEDERSFYGFGTTWG